MNWIAVPVVAMSAICFYVGYYYLQMFIRRRQEKINIAFAFSCFTVALYDVFCIGLYNAESFAEGMYWQRLQFACIAVLGCALFWYVTLLSRFRNKKLVRAIIACGLAVSIVPLVVRNDLTLSLENPAPKHIAIGQWFDFTYMEVDPGLLLIIECVLFLALFLWILINAIVCYKKAESTVRPIIISCIVFYLAAANDSLVGAGVYPFVYMLEYAFLFMILSMARIMLRRFVKLHSEVEELNIGLEEKVTRRTAALNNANQELEEARSSLWSEMQLARKIQTVLLPERPSIEGFEIAAYMAPASEVGGDYYDFISAGDREWLVIGDVSGHGVSAGLVMMMAQTAIQTTLRHNSELEPSELLQIINRAISYNIKLMGEEKYMTLNVFSLDKNGMLGFSGLHQDILVYRAQNTNDRIETVETSGMWIGVVDEIGELLEDRELRVGVSDVVVAFTDGIIEARKRNQSGKDTNGVTDMFGQQRLAAVLAANGMRSAEDIKESILEKMKGYHSDDDITFIVLKRVENNAEGEGKDSALG